MKKKSVSLYIDTSAWDCGRLVLLFSKRRVEKNFFSKRAHSERLLLALSKLLSQTHTQLSDLREIHVNPGPGAFSSIRTGVAMAQALGLALNIPVRGARSENQTPSAKPTKFSRRLTSSKQILPTYASPPRITIPKVFPGLTKR